MQRLKYTVAEHIGASREMEPPMAIPEELLVEFNKSEVVKLGVMTNNMYLPPWLTTILVGGYLGSGVQLNVCEIESEVGLTIVVFTFFVALDTHLQ